MQKYCYDMSTTFSFFLFLGAFFEFNMKTQGISTNTFVLNINQYMTSVFHQFGRLMRASSDDRTGFNTDILPETHSTQVKSVFSYAPGFMHYFQSRKINPKNGLPKF